MRLRSAFLAGFLVEAGLLAATIPGDATRGAELFKSQQCVTCHSIHGEGGKSAPDLGKSTGRAYTPATMAGLMWNHAPAMWSAMDAAKVRKPNLSEQQAADLFAYFFAQRFFDKPGDAGRGRKVFADKRCADCHGLSTSPMPDATPVTMWSTPSDSISLARAMWNHAPRMKQALDGRKIAWPRLSSQDMTDLVVYVKNVPGARPAAPQFAPASAETGETLFGLKGCAGCHKGNLDLASGRLRNRTLPDLAAGMWNHAQSMTQKPPELNDAEMRRLVGYLWSIQYFDAPGDAARGAKVFTRMQCATCHSSGGPGPTLAGRKGFNGISLVSALWQHGPAMLDQMKQKNVQWPRFRNTDVNDLLAHISSLK